MIKKNRDELIYACNIVSNNINIPIRIFENGEQFYSTIANYIQFDPLSIDFDSLLSKQEPVGYITTALDYYYGYVNFAPYLLIIGPTKQSGFEDQIIEYWNRQLLIPDDMQGEFNKSLKSIKQMSIESFTQALCLLNYITTGKQIMPAELVLSKKTQDNISSQTKEIHVKDVVSEETDNTHAIAYIAEKKILELVKRGNLKEFNDFIKRYPAVEGGKVSSNQIRQIKDIIITLATLVSRTAIDTGVDINDALILCDHHIRNCELCNDVETLENMNYQIIVDYIDLVNKSTALNLSQISQKARIYVRDNITKPITTQDVATSLKVSRPYLSSIFKKENGISLSSYILNTKIEEACYMLEYTNKTILDISIHLGFSSQGHFTNTFKKIKGITPIQVRKRS